MSQTQKQALRMMSDDNAGAIPVNGKWIFPEHIRQSEAIAILVVAYYERRAA